MRVALDAIPLAAAKTGIGHYTDALAKWLARVHIDHQYELISPFDFEFDPCNGCPGNLSKRYMPVRSIFRKWWLVGLPSLLRISPVDVFHGTNYCIPIFAPCPTVVTVHDMSLLAQSVTHESDNVKRGKRRLPIMIRRASMVIAPSEWTKRETLRYFGIKPDKIRVIPEGARDIMRPIPMDECHPILEKHQIRPPYLLYVGTIEPRKNISTIVRAYYELLSATTHHPQLVICGGRGWLEDGVFKLVDELKLNDKVNFTGYVDDGDLPAIYSAAEAFIYPSIYEGFGLPPLEAMACGTPVITSNVSSLPEVVGDSGLMHAPDDHQQLARHIVNLLSDKSTHEKFRRAGFEQASRFSWERAARETQSVYDEVFEKWHK